jgi:hypothetical protein
MLNLMLEAALSLPRVQRAPDTPLDRQTIRTLSPGLRGGWNVGDRQIVLGIAAPITWGPGRVDPGVFWYASYELPFRHPSSSQPAPPQDEARPRP